MSDVFQTTGEKFKEIFLANQGYETFVLEEKREDGKRKSKTTKIYIKGTLNYSFYSRLTRRSTPTPQPGISQKIYDRPT